MRNFLAESAGALINLGDEGWENDSGPLGTVFPISEPERLFLGARHTLGTGRRLG
jgi:hypothetical protein